MLHKKYLDTGLGLLSYIKPIVYFIGGGMIIIQKNLESILFAICLNILHNLIAYLIGMFWLKKKLYTYELEVSNFFNLFVKEMRRKIK